MRRGTSADLDPDSLAAEKEDQEAQLLEQCVREDWSEAPEGDNHLESALGRLPVKDQIVIGSLYYSHASQRTLARQLGLTQAAICERLRAARRRLSWVLREEGSLFSSEDIPVAFRGILSPSEIAILVDLWTTTTYSPHGRDQCLFAVGLVHAVVAKRPELSRFAVGFDTLLSSRMRILNTWECTREHNHRVGANVQSRWDRGSLRGY